MSLAKRLLHPHYVANVILAVSYPAYQLISHPEYLSTSSVAAYSRYTLPAVALLMIKVRGSQSEEELVSVLALYIKVFSLYGFWTIAEDRADFLGMSWIIFTVFSQPPYQGPSKVIWLDASQLDFLTTPNRSNPKGKERADSNHVLKNRGSAKITELDEDGDPLEEGDGNTDDSIVQDRDHKDDSESRSASELDPSHYWIIAFNATWSSPCRYFEAVLARCSLKYDKKNVHFAKIDMDLIPEGNQIAKRFKINLAATTLDLPTLILFKDGKALKQLPLKLGTTVGGEVIGKVGWDRSENSVVSAFELAKLGTGKESFVA
ncbi:Thioredoxin- transmembrane protein 2 [Entomortierella chlamydospora]|uniref:Thioredoxin- transmembrane protein 2 n=1 Tax=Entomortierella chlamydospora TaxID=101097 RepID=A0A9P6MZC0_9FUNG|nr:Thioredoxin- transmembrane protein 2 [Entomortierella chlamydospora]KAG0018204.1 Thioredoxin- transmembrane protein 2 [Entomortierella chlamydospora]